MPPPTALIPARQTSTKQQQQTSRCKKPYTRTKHGCRPCKFRQPCALQRRIRCDEGWPVCRNCTKASRPCERGLPPSRRAEAASLTFKTPLTVAHFRPPPSRLLDGLAREDIPYLDAFRYRLVDDIVGNLTRPAWKGGMMQALHREPAFRHAVVAFGAACGLVDGAEWPSAGGDSGLPVPVPAPNKTLALRHYNRCLQGVQGLIARGESGHVDSILFCALMCICFELRVGTPHLVIHHLEHSLNIIKANPAAVSDDLILAFAKLDIQASMFLGSRAPTTDMTRLSGLSLGSVGGTAEMDKALTCLLGRIVLFLRTNPGVFRRLGPIPMTPSICEDLATLIEDLERFRASHAVEGVPDLATAKAQPPPRQILWITCLILHVVLASCLHGDDEMVYDLFLAHFEAITVLSENMLRSSTCRYAAGYKDFRLNTALLYPLYMTGQLCRHPGIRRRVLRLMSSVSFDEGVWDGASGLKYVEVLVRLEEQGLALGGASDWDSCGPSIIPNRNRIRALDLQPAAAERYSTLFYRFSREAGQWSDLAEAIAW